MSNIFYIIGGFAVVAIALATGSKWGAMLVVLIVLGMLLAVKNKL